MNPDATSNSFIFNNEIDGHSMNELYGADYPYIEEVFNTVLNEYEALVSNVLSAHQSGNIPSLRAAVHKIKPVFGFVGLTEAHKQCQQFENLCMSMGGAGDIEKEFASLKNKLEQSQLLIEEEMQRLRSFNQNA
jgi:HPt (histidine-containing phosphotransfer) domain-containing protein